jgi:hypothetical protein
MDVIAKNRASAAPEEKPVKPMPKLERFAHWMVNYVGIGWVLNAIASVTVYHAVANKLPAPPPGDAKYNSFGAKLGRFLKEETAPGTATTPGKLGREALRIAALGSGGFLVLPLQDWYTKNQAKISNAVRRVFCREPVAEPEREKEEHHANGKRWALARVISFTAGITGFLLFKHGFSKAYTAMGNYTERKSQNSGSYVGHFLAKVEHKESYIAEQIAAGSAAITLWAAKKLLDGHSHRTHEERLKHERMQTAETSVSM